MSSIRQKHCRSKKNLLYLQLPGIPIVMAINPWADHNTKRATAY